MHLFDITYLSKCFNHGEKTSKMINRVQKWETHQALIMDTKIVYAHIEYHCTHGIWKNALTLMTKYTHNKKNSHNIIFFWTGFTQNYFNVTIYKIIQNYRQLFCLGGLAHIDLDVNVKKIKVK